MYSYSSPLTSKSNDLLILLTYEVGNALMGENEKVIFSMSPPNVPFKHYLIKYLSK